MVAAHAVWRAEAELGEGGEEEADGKELEEHRPGLLDAFAMLGFGRSFGGGPEAEGGDADFAARAVEEVEGEDAAADQPPDGEELAEAQIEKEHLAAAP